MRFEVFNTKPGFYDTGFVFRRIGSVLRGSSTFFKGSDRVFGFGLNCWFFLGSGSFSKDWIGFFGFGFSFWFFLRFGSGFRGSSTFFKGSGSVFGFQD